MEIAQKERFDVRHSEVKGRDSTIMLAYAAFAILLVLGLYWISVSSGAAPSDFAMMTVFP